MTEEPRPAGPGGMLQLPLVVLDEIMEVVPRLVDRTRRQAELARRLASHVPCLGGLLATPGPVPTPAHESVPVDVLSVLAAEDVGEDRSTAALVPTANGGAPRNGTGTTSGRGDHDRADAADVPDRDDLAVPDYDALAASQVVPRLATLSPEELEAVGRYERAHRNRQTILNKVSQLLGG